MSVWRKAWTALRPKPGWQWARRAVQAAAIALLFALPVLARYNNYLASRELDGVMERWQDRSQGGVLAATDKVLRATGSEEQVFEGNPRRNREELQERLARYRGSVWSVEIAGVSMTDPLAVAESASASKQLRWVLFVGLLLPLGVTLILGRVFCSWVCPMNTLLEFTDKLRGVLKFLELPPHNLRFWRGNKFLLLGMGILAALLFSVPLLGYFYPPAIFGREIHNWVNGFFDRAEAGAPGISWLGGLSIASGFLLGIVVLEVFVSERLWCRYLCPGGALYCLLGKFRTVRVRRDVAKCTDCADCITVCGMGLNPMRDVTGIECDNCALCITHCEPRALSFRFDLFDPRPQGPGQGLPKVPIAPPPEPKAVDAPEQTEAVVS